MVNVLNRRSTLRIDSMVNISVTKDFDHTFQISKVVSTAKDPLCNNIVLYNFKYRVL